MYFQILMAIITVGSLCVGMVVGSEIGGYFTEKWMRKKLKDEGYL